VVSTQSTTRYGEDIFFFFFFFWGGGVCRLSLLTSLIYCLFWDTQRVVSCCTRQSICFFIVHFSSVLFVGGRKLPLMQDVEILLGVMPRGHLHRINASHQL
jgi:hypothetical protein